MLKPITKRMTDESEGESYRFTFYCDICGHPWSSVPYCGDTGPGGVTGNTLSRESEHIAAYERANREAIMHFNRCPVCRRVVCDQCFHILAERDMCKECMCAGE